MNWKNVFLPLFIIALLALYAQAASGGAGGNEAVIRSLYGSMDRALSAGNEDEAMTHYNGLAAYGKEAAALFNVLVTSAPLSQKTYNAACSLWKQVGDKDIGGVGLRYLLRSPYSDDVVKTKCLHYLRAWKDQTIEGDAERLFDDKSRDENLRVVAADVLRKLNPQKARVKFLRVLDDGTEGMLINYKAVQYLGAYKDPEVRAKIKRHILDGSRSSELSKERALILFASPEQAGSAEEVAEVMQSTGASAALKERSITILSSPRMMGAGGKKALEGFVKKTGDPVLKRQAQRALGEQVPGEPAQGVP